MPTNVPRLTKVSLGTSSRAARRPPTPRYRLVNVGWPTGATGTDIELTSSTSDDNIEGMISAVDKTHDQRRHATTSAPSDSASIMQDDFVADLMD